MGHDGELVMYRAADGGTPVRSPIGGVLTASRVDEAATADSELTVRIEGTREVLRNVDVYLLDMVLAVG